MNLVSSFNASLFPFHSNSDLLFQKKVIVRKVPPSLQHTHTTFINTLKDNTDAQGHNSWKQEACLHLTQKCYTDTNISDISETPSKVTQPPHPGTTPHKFNTQISTMHATSQACTLNIHGVCTARVPPVQTPVTSTPHTHFISQVYSSELEYPDSQTQCAHTGHSAQINTPYVCVEVPIHRPKLPLHKNTKHVDWDQERIWNWACHVEHSEVSLSQAAASLWCFYCTKYCLEFCSLS